MFKEFTESEIGPIIYNNKKTIIVSEDSASASNVHFFTGIRSIGKIKFFDITQPPAFGLSLDSELKYQFLCDKSTIPGSSLTAERTSGIFLSDNDQEYVSSSNANSSASHQSIFNYTKGYLYRDNNKFVSTTAFQSASTAITTSIIRMISVRKELFNSSIEPNSIRLEMNLSNTSVTGVVIGSATGLVTAVDFKNPIRGQSGLDKNSYFAVPWTSMAGAASANGSSIDVATSGITIEAIIRPYNNGVLLWRRLASDNWAGTNVESQNSFMKLELTKSADDTRDAFRFSIRSVNANGDFSEDFAKSNVQTSGLFVPDDVGINIFDGRFHHIIVTWGVSGVDNQATTTESGAGAVFGYIDGYKLLNKEQVEPRLGGEDDANGPAIQANMFEQRIPIRSVPIETHDPKDASPSGNTLFIGLSNYNRELSDTTGDRGDPSSLSSDANIRGQYDGQVQSVRFWNIRFNDGSTGITDNINKIVSGSTCAGISFDNFHNTTLSGHNNVRAWWLFNERNTLSADDRSAFSNTGTIYGNSNIRLYDIRDNTVTGDFGDSFTDSGISAVDRTYLYSDRPEPGIVGNDIMGGRIVRQAFDGTATRVGTIFYDLGLIIIDADDPNASLNFLWPSSGTTGDFGFAVTGNLNTAFNVNRFRFNSVDSRGRLMTTSVASGSEFNYTTNPTGTNPETEETLFDEPTSYITSVGFYNDQNELLAIGKLSAPVKKDESRKLEIQAKLDF